MAQAAKQRKRAPAKKETNGEPKRRATTLPKEEHARRCPGRDDPKEARAEAFEAVRPAAPAAGRPYARLYKITRCIECGGQVRKKLRDLVPLDPDDDDDHDLDDEV